MTTMHLFQNAETIDRLVKQGEFVLTTYHAEYDKDPASFHAEFLRGDFQAGAARYTRYTAIHGRNY